MSKEGGLSDTRKLHGIPDNHPHGQAQSPDRAIRRASMMGNESGKKIPNKRQPEKVKNAPAKNKKSKPQLSRKVKPARKHGVLFRVLVALLVLILTVFCVYSAAAITAIQRLNTEETTERHLSSGAVAEDKKVTNIVLITTDEWNQQSGNADSVTLISFSKHNHTMTQTALKNDCYVSIPEHGTDRLTAAYSYGGSQLLTDTIENNFDIPVKYYMTFGIPAFIALTDALDGIDITMNAKEASAVNQMLNAAVNEKVGDPVDADYLPGGGTYRLSGKQAICYMEISADQEQSSRRNAVIEQLINRAKKMSPSALIKIIRDVCPNIRTNIPGGSLYLAALKAPYVLLRYHSQDLELPQDGTFSEQTAQDGSSVLAVDFDKNLEAYQKAITE